MNTRDRKLLLRNGILVILFVTVLAFISIQYGPAVLGLLSNMDRFRDAVLSFGRLGLLVFVLFQIAHIIVPFLPGELVQIGGGFLFGVGFGTLYMLIGTVIGTVLVFYISRVLGYPIVRIFVKEDKMVQFTGLMSSRRVEIILLLLFLLPGVPKDTLIYIAGLTPVKALRFICISILARTPGLIGSAYIGANLQQRDYKTALVLVIISCLLFLVGVSCRKWVLRAE